MHTAEKSNLEKLLFIFSYGMTECLKAGAIEIDEAERLLYWPGLMNELEELNFSKELVDVIHLGTELDDVGRLMPDKLESSLDYLSDLALQNIKKLPPVLY